MKRLLPCLLISMFVLSGCAGHYYRKNNDTVSIFLEKPDASRVYFLSSLDGYKPQRAARLGNRTWQIDAPAEAEFKYFYNVDGAVYLPDCRLKEQDDFGSKICIYIPEL